MLHRMDDPTGELRRQRELVAAHLRWLDEQIARNSGLPPRPPSAPAVAISTPQPPPVGAMASTSPPQGSPAAAAQFPEIVLPEIDPGSIRNEVRRGCLIYVIIATVLLAASVGVAVWISRG